MRVEPKIIIGILSLLVTLFAGGLLAISGKFHLESGLKVGGEVNVSKGNEPAQKHNYTETIKPTPTPTVIVPGETKTTPGNITDEWISERSLKKYFIKEMNNIIEIFESDGNNEKRLVGNGIRNGEKVTILFNSTITGGIEGTLKLNISPDGKTLTGNFSELGEPGKEGVVRMLRSAS